MRLVLKSVLGLLALYVVLIAGLIWWLRATIDGNTRTLIEETARLVGIEVATAINDEVVDDLLAGRAGEADVLETIDDVARRSQLVRAVKVVDRDGKVIASDGSAGAEERLPAPGELFAEDSRSRLTTRTFRLSAPVVLLDIPLLRAGEPIGYLRLSLGSARIAGLYHEQRRQMFQLAVAGLLVIGFLAFALHAFIQQADARLAAALENAVEGRPAAAAGKPGEFSRALATAGRLGQELSRQRGSTASARLRLSRLSELMDVGVLLLESGSGVDFASNRVLDLLDGDESRLEALRQKLVPHLQLLRDGGEGSNIDLQLDAGEAGTQSLRCHVYLLEEEDSVGYLILVRDRRVIASLETDLRLASRFRDVTQLYLGVAHDLKAPLNAMVLHLELLRQSITGKDEAATSREQQAEWLRVLDEEVGRLERSLGALLAQTAPSSPDSERFDLGGVLAELEVLLKPQARQQRVELVTVRAEESAGIVAHRDQVKQALLSIAVNGLEAMATGGTLTLRHEHLDGHAVLQVEDTGPGVPAEARDRIFDMHFSTKSTGTGIGLYVARSIIEAHHGRLELAETGPGGSTFRVRLPVESS